MELREPIADINRKLKDEFGLEEDGRPKFRIVFSDDMYEKRITEYNDKGELLLTPEVRLLPKYKQWVHARYILERLVPVVGETDLTEKITYQPAWIFQDRHRNYLPPFFDACKFIIEGLYEAMGKRGGFAKYRDTEATEEVRMQKVEDMIKLLFGNETPVGDALAYGSGVSLSTPVKQEKVM